MNSAPLERKILPKGFIISIKQSNLIFQNMEAMQRSLPRGRQEALTKDGMYSKACDRVKAQFQYAFTKNMKNFMELTKTLSSF